MGLADESFTGRMRVAAVSVLALASWTIALVLLRGAVARADSSRRANSRSSPELRVCADPNNLPFSNARGEGFENQLAELVARQLGQRVSYTFWPQRRGFIKNTLAEKRCDVIIGVPAHFELTETTRAYYRSSYVFVVRAADEAPPKSLDDPVLRTLRIGMHLIGDDYNNIPPAQSLARRGIVNNVSGYTVYGDYSQPTPTRTLFEELDRKEIDVAIAWGPLAGPFVKQSNGRLRLGNVTPDPDDPALPMSFEIAMGVRHGDSALREKLDIVLAEQRASIHALLTRFGVPFEAVEDDEQR